MPWLLGTQWGQAGPIFFWLGLVGLLQPVSNLTGVLFVSSGRSRAMLKWGAVSAVVTLVAFAIGLRWGAVGIAAALFWSLTLRIPFLFWWCTRGNAVRQSDLYASQIEPLGGPLVIAIAAALWGGRVPFTALLLGSLLLAYPAALLTSCITPGGRRIMMDLWIFMRKHFNRTLFANNRKLWPQAGEAQ
jgi:PST family polysaccharide transporter